ncbi:unnamed protein product [Boreogadus saida]
MRAEGVIREEGATELDVHRARDVGRGRGQDRRWEEYPLPPPNWRAEGASEEELKGGGQRVRREEGREGRNGEAPGVFKLDWTGRGVNERERGRQKEGLGRQRRRGGKQGRAESRTGGRPVGAGGRGGWRRRVRRGEEREVEEIEAVGETGLEAEEEGLGGTEGKDAATVGTRVATAEGYKESERRRGRREVLRS